MLVGFTLPLPNQPSLAATLATLKQQGFLRVWLNGELRRTDDPVPEGEIAPPLFDNFRNRPRRQLERASARSIIGKSDTLHPKS